MQELVGACLFLDRNHPSARVIIITGWALPPPSCRISRHSSIQVFVAAGPDQRIRFRTCISVDFG